MSALPGHAQARHSATVSEADLTWQRDARCAGADPQLFFNPTREGVRPQKVAAIKICLGCRVRLECLHYALTHPDGKHGIWGGATEAELKRLRQARGAA